MLFCALVCTTAGGQALPPGAVAVSVDVATGATTMVGVGSEQPGAPGSTIKPFVLFAALRAGTVTERSTVACLGHLVVAGRDVSCTHPRDITVLDAREALAESCNTYFAQTGRRLSAEAMRQGVAGFGIALTGPLASPEQRALAALGLQGVAVSPLQLARAYRRLAQQMNAHVRFTDVVRDGMLASVQSGMAHGAATEGVRLLGKTGTVHAAAPVYQWGWFAGIVPWPGDPGAAERVLVVRVAGGNGKDAALLAHRLLLSGAVASR